MFVLDNRLIESSFLLGDWPLSQVLLKNEAAYPWFILVPRKAGVSEWYELTDSERAMLMDEIQALSLLVTEQFKPYKLNVGSLGNQVAQLHVHVVGRNPGDPLWPQGVWQANHQSKAYTDSALQGLLPELKSQVRSRFLIVS